jgi:hypothetical protein
MISSMQCRIYAVECKVLASSSGISIQRSLEQTIMALNWTALADEIDREKAKPDWLHSLRWIPPPYSRTSRALDALFIRLANPPLDRGKPC